MEKHRFMTGFLDTGDNFRPLQIVDVGHRHRGTFARQ
jgi:hypothetical protein